MWIGFRSPALLLRVAGNCPTVVLFLVGNKMDIRTAESVPKSQAEDFAHAIGANFVETSAKDNTGELMAPLPCVCFCPSSPSLGTGCAALFKKVPPGYPMKDPPHSDPLDPQASKKPS